MVVFLMTEIFIFLNLKKKKKKRKYRSFQLKKKQKTVEFASKLIKGGWWGVILIVWKIQPVSYKRYFRCNNCFLLIVYTIHLSLSTDLVDPPPLRTLYIKHPLLEAHSHVKRFTKLQYAQKYDFLQIRI